jgi:hypothetical protein
MFLAILSVVWFSLWLFAAGPDTASPISLVEVLDDLLHAGFAC